MATTIPKLEPKLVTLEQVKATTQTVVAVWVKDACPFCDMLKRQIRSIKAEGCVMVVLVSATKEKQLPAYVKGVPCVAKYKGGKLLHSCMAPSLKEFKELVKAT